MSEPLVLDGKSLAKKLETELAARVAGLRKKLSVMPTLATILVGDDPASATYVRMKGNACRRVGLESLQVKMSADSSTEDVIHRIGQLNEDPAVFGILLQHPVPDQVDERACFDTISVDKDVDGVTSHGFGRMAMGLPAYPSATPGGIMRILAHYDLDPEGAHAIIVGRSPILGKPLAQLLLNANATVTLCHSRTQGLPDIVRSGDIVVGAVGKPRFIRAEWLRPGAVLIDAGYNPGKVGDIDLEQAAPKSRAYTPVPGGVGPMTIATLIAQTVEAVERSA
ncbi:MAG: bifunctional 5,10-methylene-tetrahydrofolate dehydrogenase/5,10-methylene-tetrahydrofolate cyclohydrolase [Spirochaetes bacterium]|jgi:methylenetetrahydrofolate dehydrogenase (NADP+)/methenyltetrahydrofolate cyclohydrolase|nr:bifunctional 5,10-methylene-tetrahydrofolate dehydrogenase/5,10-methylene-tetrahydrofolate cyclohydrolase [Spirochaetota bacterium]